MRLIDDPTGWLVEIDSQTVPLKDLCRRSRLEAGLTLNALEMMSGLSHPTVGSYEIGKTKSVGAMLSVLLTLGYSIELKEPEAPNG